jgi:hypothetical protein
VINRLHKAKCPLGGQAADISETTRYWDETRDAGSFSKSVLFDATYGFGSGGTGSNPCVPNGPFYNMTVNIGQGFSDNPRCVNRQITDFLSTQTGASYVKSAIAPTNYNDAARAIYMGPHLMGHEALAMMNGDSITSAGDPLFMMHHGFVDKMWFDWQSQNKSRLTAIGGLNAQDPNLGFWEFSGTQASQVSYITLKDTHLNYCDSKTNVVRGFNVGDAICCSACHYAESAVW